MADDWRLVVVPSGDADPPSVLGWLLEHELEDDARSRLGHTLAVEVSPGDDAIFVYADSEGPIREAERIVSAVLDEEGVEARVEVSRWHPLEERWEDAAVPLPQTEAERRSETERLAAEQTADSQEGGPEWEVRLELPGHAETAELADRLEQEGIPVLRRWRFLLVGGDNEEQANELAERLRHEAPSETMISVEGSRASLDEAALPNPFVVFGGLGT
jgi:hypothetical protein